MLLRKLLGMIIKKGHLGYIDARGRRDDFGDRDGPSATIRIHDRKTEWLMALNTPVAMGEAYMDGRLTIEEGTLESFLKVAAINYSHLEAHWVYRLGSLLLRQARWVKQHNPMPKARANVAHHYDLSGKLYDLFLDPDRQYSCAYFTSPENSLEQAQRDKKRHIAAKLLLGEKDLKLLDIGSGWGGLGLFLAREGAENVTGVTLSVEQHKLSTERAEKAGLADRVQFHLRDYRDQQGPFDRIVSVGMFEHVGKANYEEFFAKTYDLLDENGVFLLHTIGRVNEPGPINPFIRKYIFPGADLPTLSEVTPVIEKAGFFITDIEILHLHYAETLRHWYNRFQANRGKAAQLYDERFCRMWELYLKGCELGFRHQGLTVFQIQLARRMEAVPRTRDYIYEWEHGRGAKEVRQPRESRASAAE